MFSHDAGLADPAASISANASTTFHTYLVTTTFTSAAVLQRVEYGHTDLDYPIARYLGPLLHRGALTTRQTLLHTAGFANPNPMAWGASCRRRRDPHV
jgi:CubicO group peptidase (beta-lactamase class C family)